MRLDEGRIAVDFITFRRRIDDRFVKVPDGVDDIRSLPVLTGFALSLERYYSRYRLDDVADILNKFIRRYRSLVDWYQAAVDSRGIEVRFYAGSPHVAQLGFARWRELSAELDPDALIALQYARTYRTEASAGQLFAWGTYVTSDDHQIDRLLERGIGDLHTHLGGCENVPLIWQDLVCGARKLHQFPRYGESAIARRKEHRSAQLDLEQDRKIVQDGLNAALELDGLLESGRARGSAFLSHPDLQTTSPIGRALWPERARLIRAWNTLLDDRQSDLAGTELASKLDAYLAAKHTFLRDHIQYPGSNPGLQNFRRFLDASRPREAEVPPRHEWARRLRLVQTACESECLRLIELRIAPWDSVAEYVRFFRRWKSRILDNTFIDRRGIRIGVIIHFIRFRHPLRDDGAAISMSALRRRLDRQTAVLHRFRRDYPREASHIVGIDVANLERNHPIELFSPYLRLLRGSQKLETTVLGSSYLRRWSDLYRTSSHSMPPEAPVLGLTVHAGEDFFHPLDGLRSIAESIESCEMRPEDRIGHALAAGLDIPSFNAQYDASIMVPDGVALDSLVWFHARLRKQNSIPAPVLRKVEDEIAGLSRNIYGWLVPIPELRLLALLRREPLSETLKYEEELRRRFSKTAVQAWMQELRDRGCRDRRDETNTIPKVYLEHDISVAMEQVQSELIRDIAKSEIFIEANPSSNLATGTIERLRDHPLFRMRKIDRGVCLTLNCDDPGTFATRIENEFALLKDAMQELRMPAAEIADFLQHLVTSAERAAFIRERAARGESLGKLPLSEASLSLDASRSPA